MDTKTVVIILSIISLSLINIIRSDCGHFGTEPLDICISDNSVSSHKYICDSKNPSSTPYTKFQWIYSTNCNGYATQDFPMKCPNNISCSTCSSDDQSTCEYAKITITEHCADDDDDDDGDLIETKTVALSECIEIGSTKQAVQYTCARDNMTLYERLYNDATCNDYIQKSLIIMKDGQTIRNETSNCTYVMAVGGCGYDDSSDADDDGDDDMTTEGVVILVVIIVIGLITIICFFRLFTHDNSKDPEREAYRFLREEPLEAERTLAMLKIGRLKWEETDFQDGTAIPVVQRVVFASDHHEVPYSIMDDNL